MEYRLDDFDYHLPSALIAQRPADPRDSSRLLVYDRASGAITDSIFSDIGKYLAPKTTLVLNDSKVDKCRLKFPGKEIFIVKEIDTRTVEALVFPGRLFQAGQVVLLAEAISGEVLAIDDDGLRTIQLSCAVNDACLDPFRQTPLPPYIQYDQKLGSSYQTVYAEFRGSQAAPTAGLHFTPQLLKRLATDHPIAKLTLHVGLGTFAPVKNQNLEGVHLHSEWFGINAQAAGKLNQAKHITAVGTTSLRTLESAVLPERHFQAVSGYTDIFIKPGYRFRAVDSLLTNFHLPKSTLLMLVAAFMGYDGMRRIYAHAIERQYRFYSFGDAMLIL